MHMRERVGTSDAQQERNMLMCDARATCAHETQTTHDERVPLLCLDHSPWDLSGEWVCR
jgi:hypothetical protein